MNRSVIRSSRGATNYSAKYFVLMFKAIFYTLWKMQIEEQMKLKLKRQRRAVRTSSGLIFLDVTKQLLNSSTRNRVVDLCSKSQWNSSTSKVVSLQAVLNQFIEWQQRLHELSVTLLHYWRLEKILDQRCTDLL